jgi:uncharacterized membrane protein YqgA involved in biofilm formation
MPFQGMLSGGSTLHKATYTTEMSNTLRNIIWAIISVIVLSYGFEYISSSIRKQSFQHPSMTILFGAVVGTIITILRIRKN